jgi:hypothetical protein
MTKRRQWILISIAVIAALVALRAALPWFVTRYVNKTLHDMEDYGGSVADVDMALYRGAYTIDNIKVFKVNGNSNREIPFIEIPKIELRVQWDALLEGALVGRAVLYQPELNFINKEQAGEKVDWVERAKELFPVRINRFEIVNGTVTYYDFTTEPNVDLRLKDLQLVATNFANVEDPSEAERKAAERAQSAGGNEQEQDPEQREKEEKALPAAIRATAVSIGGGELDLDMRLDPLQKVPNLDMNLRFESVHMPALNEFFRAYAGIDVEQGTFSVYSEMAVNDGVVKGYIKPVAENVEILDLKKDAKNPISLLWESIVAFAAEIFENKPKEQLATQIPLSGDLNNLETSVWVALWNIYRNGFVQAFSKSTNDSIDFSDVSETGKNG